ncbi:MAG: ATP-binding cassette domain-containing protein [Deltaproteobacteria bacterium]|nr:ATP-binding cassette domain-containing protein [Deltaproteobacteria bacterium]
MTTLTSRQNAIISVQNVETYFGGKAVHQGISLDIYPGKIVSLIGGSGTGKSTLLREIVGLLPPTRGEIFLFGKNVWRQSEDKMIALRRRFGMLFQDGALFSGLSVRENIAIPLVEQTQIASPIIEDLVDMWLGLVGLSVDTGDKVPSELSGGMRKRVALARALVLEPEIIFLDEPTSGLDPINARAFDKLIKTLSESLGLTVFIVTHDLDTICGITDRLIVLEQGKVLADGAVKNVAKIKHPWIESYFNSRADH